MKKKLSILPIVILALTMLFGTVSVWADAMITKIEINMPISCEGETAENFLRGIDVKAYNADQTEYVDVLEQLEYDKSLGSFFVNANQYPYTFHTDTVMTNGIYTISLLLKAKVGYDFTYPFSTVTVNGSSVSFTPSGGVPGAGVLRVAFPYTFGAIPQSACTEKEAVAIIDRDLFKSEAPSKTVIVADSIGAKSFFDMKVHAADAQTQANQKLLAQNLVGANTKIFVTENIYPRRDLSISENGSLKVLNWNNLPKNQPGAISAVVYNQIDGAYTIHGILDANGTATFTGFKLRPASTITICK